MTRIKIQSLQVLQNKGLVSSFDSDSLIAPLSSVMEDLHHAKDTLVMHTASRHSLSRHVYGHSWLFQWCSPKKKEEEEGGEGKGRQGAGKQQQLQQPPPQQQELGSAAGVTL
jgi:hypothetical protein